MNPRVWRARFLGWQRSGCDSNRRAAVFGVFLVSEATSEAAWAGVQCAPEAESSERNWRGRLTEQGAVFSGKSRGNARLMGSSAERRALNEASFREANEQLERGARRITRGDEASLVPFLCECPRQECTKVVALTLREYEEVRSMSRQGLAVPGHEDLEIERVVAENERYLVTEKFGRAGDVFEEEDPRR